MSTTIDERVVRARFDNSLFQKGVETTITALDKLKQKLDLTGAAKGLQDVGSAAKNMTLGALANGVDNISSKFTALNAVALSVLNNITSKAVDAGLKLAKSLSVDPIAEGFSDYNAKLTSVQTIMNATGKSIQVVDGYFKQLDTYADKTVFNLKDMTGAFAKFTNAGIPLEKSVPMIKGIANMTALAGQGADAAAIGMYNLSQSLAGGFLTTTDYKSLNLANIATKEWKQHMVDAAVSAGKLKKVGPDAYILAGSKSKEASNTAQLFNDKLAEGWASAEVLTKVLGDYGDATTKIGKKALSAAQDVKSLPMMMETLKAAVGTGWTDSFELIFGNVEESKKLFTGLTTRIGGVLDGMSAARNNLLKGWKDNGGRDAAIQALYNAFDALGSILGPIKAAFRDIFPATTGKQLADITKNIAAFFKNLKMGEGTAFKIRLIFQGFFAALDIGWMIIKKVAGVIKDLLGTASEGSGGFLDFAVKIANWITSLRYAIKYGDGLTKFFEGLTAVLRLPVKFLLAIGSAIAAAFGGFASAGPAVDKINGNLAEMGEAGKGVVTIWDRIKGAFSGLVNFFKPITDKISEMFGGITNVIRDSFSGGEYGQILQSLQTGLLGGILLLLRKFVNDGLSLDLSGGAFGALGGVFEQLTGSLKTMQQAVKANMILKIAAALALLTISVVALAMIDPAALTRAMGALTVMFLQLSGALLLFEKAASFGGAARLPFIAAGLILLSIAIGLLVISVKMLASMSWEELVKGMTGLMVILGSLVAFTQGLAKNSSQMILAGLGFIALAVAINLFALAVKQFASMNWAEMSKGLVGVGSMLGALAIFTRMAKLSKIGLSSGIGLILLATAIKIMASAVADFGGMDLATLGKGMGAMAISLALIGGALRLIPKSAIIQAATLVVVSSALLELANALKVMGAMPMEQILKGLGTLGGALGLLAIGLRLMSGTVAGAAALWISIDAINNLAIVLATLGAIGVTGSIAALATIAGALTILGLAGLIMAPVLPVLQSLGFAILTMGIGAAAAGIGLLAAATGLVALAGAGAGAGLAIAAIAAAIIGVLPAAMQALAVGLVLMVKVIGDQAPAFVEAMVKLMIALLDGIDTMVPRILESVFKLLDNLLSGIQKNLPRFLQKGIDIIVSVLNGITRNLPRILSAGGDLIVQFIRGIGDQATKITKAAAETIIKFMNGLAQTIRDNSSNFNQAGLDILSAIVSGMVNGVGQFAGMLWDAAQRIASSFLNGIKSFFGIASPSKLMYQMGAFVMQGFRNGLDGNAGQVKASFDNLKKMLTDNLKTMAAGIKTLEDKLKKLNRSPRKNRAEIAKTKAALAQAKAEYVATGAALTELTKNWSDDNANLQKLANSYDVLTTKIKSANEKLAEATKTRDDYAKTLKDQYGDIPDISGETTAEKFAADMRKQIADTLAFGSALQKLRKMGLNDTLYRELLAKGPGALPFVQDLLAVGDTGVKQLNGLSAELDKVAGDFGKVGASQLYQAAVDSAAGLVKGLQNQQGAIEIQMDKIADAMVKAIKKKLGIKSPSRAFMDIGKWSNEGLAKGLSKYSGIVEKSAETVGHSAIESMRKSISGLSELVSGEFELAPVITPVLDLSKVRQEAGNIGLGAPTLTVAPAYTSARKAQASINANALQSEGQPFQESVVRETVFNQNNYSPKALSDAEIYRQTKSLISTTKGAVTP